MLLAKESVIVVSVDGSDSRTLLTKFLMKKWRPFLVYGDFNMIFFFLVNKICLSNQEFFNQNHFFITLF